MGPSSSTCLLTITWYGMSARIPAATSPAVLP